MCGCGKKVARATEASPVLLGEPNGVSVQARVTVRFSGLKAGEVGWFSGTDVGVYVARALLVPL